MIFGKKIPKLDKQDKNQKNLFKRIVKRLVVFAIPINEEKVNKILVKVNCKKKIHKDQFK